MIIFSTECTKSCIDSGKMIFYFLYDRILHIDSQSV